MQNLHGLVATSDGFRLRFSLGWGFINWFCLVRLGLRVFKQGICGVNGLGFRELGCFLGFACHDL